MCSSQQLLNCDQSKWKDCICAFLPIVQIQCIKTTNDFGDGFLKLLLIVHRVQSKWNTAASANDKWPLLNARNFFGQFVKFWDSIKL